MYMVFSHNSISKQPKITLFHEFVQFAGWSIWNQKYPHVRLALASHKLAHWYHVKIEHQETSMVEIENYSF